MSFLFGERIRLNFPRKWLTRVQKYDTKYVLILFELASLLLSLYDYIFKHFII